MIFVNPLNKLFQFASLCSLSYFKITHFLLEFCV
jgi:hypothetical protein